MRGFFMEKMRRIETGRYLNSCTDCPIKESRICAAYKNGASRLVYDPLPEPEGMRLYKEPCEILESIEDCLRKQKTGRTVHSNVEEGKNS